MDDRWEDRISAYLDGEIDADETRLFEQRMLRDPGLARAVDEVRSLVRRAEALDNPLPQNDPWPAIEARLAPRERGRTPVDLGRVRERRGLTVPRWQLAAAGLAIAILSGALGWLLRGPDEPAPTDVAIEQPLSTGTDPRRAPVGVDAALANFEDERLHLAESIYALETVLLERQDRLDEETRAIVEDNLVRIDTAIREAMTALGADPDSDYLRNHLASTMQRKVRLLESATRLTHDEI